MDQGIQHGPNKTCGRQPLKTKLTISLQIFKGCLPQILFDPFLNTLTHFWCIRRFYEHKRGFHEIYSSLKSITLTSSYFMVILQSVSVILWIYSWPMFRFLYPLKTSENQSFSNVFRWYRNRALTWKRLIYFWSMFSFYNT